MAPIEMTIREFVDVISKLPNPEYMKTVPPPGYRCSVNFIKKGQGDNQKMHLSVGNKELQDYMPTTEVVFEIIFKDRMIAYWQPINPILITPVPFGWV